MILGDKIWFFLLERANDQPKLPASTGCILRCDVEVLDGTLTYSQIIATSLLSCSITCIASPEVCSPQKNLLVEDLLMLVGEQ